MSFATELIIAAVLTGAVHLALLIVAARAYLRTRNTGFLLLAVALVVVPQIDGLIDRPVSDWLQDRVGAQGTRADTASLIVAFRSAVTATLICAALVLLARPRRRPATEPLR